MGAVGFCEIFTCVLGSGCHEVSWEARWDSYLPALVGMITDAC